MIRQIKYSTTVRDRERQVYTYIHMYIERGSNVIPDGVGLLNSLVRTEMSSKFEAVFKSLSVPFRSLGGQSNPAQISHFPLLGGVNQHLAD